MNGRVCVSILQRAASYNPTLAFAAPVQVCFGSSVPAKGSATLVCLLTVAVSSCPQPQASRQLHLRPSSERLLRKARASGRRLQTGRPLSTHQHLDFQLNPVQVNSILRSNEQVHLFIYLFLKYLLEKCSIVYFPSMWFGVRMKLNEGSSSLLVEAQDPHFFPCH